MNDFPGRAMDLVRNNRLPAGANIINLESEITTPSAKEILFFITHWIVQTYLQLKFRKP